MALTPCFPFTSGSGGCRAALGFPGCGHRWMSLPLGFPGHFPSLYTFPKVCQNGNLSLQPALRVHRLWKRKSFYTGFWKPGQSKEGKSWLLIKVMSSLIYLRLDLYSLFTFFKVFSRYVQQGVYRLRKLTFIFFLQHFHNRTNKGNSKSHLQNTRYWENTQPLPLLSCTDSKPPSAAV